MKLKVLGLIILLFVCNSLISEVLVLENRAELSGKLENEDRENYYIRDNDGKLQTVPKVMVLEIRMNQEDNKQTKYYQQNIIKTKEIKNFTSLNIGYGNSYGGLGFNLNHKPGKISFHGGAGYFPIPAEFSDWADPAILYCLGLKFYMPNNQLYFDLQYGTFGIYAEEENDYWNREYSQFQETLYGPSILFGGDWLVNDKIGFNAALGLSYILNDIEMIDWTVVLALDIGLVIKL